MPKEPAAQKPQLPSIGKEKLQGRAQRPGSRRRSRLRTAKTLSRPDPSSSGGCSVYGAGYTASAAAPGLEVRGQPETAQAQRPHPHPSPRRRAVGGESKGRGTMLGRAGNSARSTGPSTPSARGRQLRRQVCCSALHSRPGRRSCGPDLPPPRRHRLPLRGEAPRSPRGGGAGASRMGRARGAGRARESRELQGRRAREAKGARKEAAGTKGAGRAALPEDPLPLWRVFG